MQRAWAVRVGTRSIRSATPGTTPSSFSIRPVDASRRPPFGTAKRRRESDGYCRRNHCTHAHCSRCSLLRRWRFRCVCTRVSISSREVLIFAIVYWVYWLLNVMDATPRLVGYFAVGGEAATCNNDGLSRCACVVECGVSAILATHQRDFLVHVAERFYLLVNYFLRVTAP